MGRIIPYEMENKSHVWNHQPAMFAILQITTEITMFPHEITIFPSQITLSPRLKSPWRFMDTWRFGWPKKTSPTSWDLNKRSLMGGRCPDVWRIGGIIQFQHISLV